MTDLIWIPVLAALIVAAYWAAERLPGTPDRPDEPTDEANYLRAARRRRSQRPNEHEYDGDVRAQAYADAELTARIVGRW